MSEGRVPAPVDLRDLWAWRLVAALWGGLALLDALGLAGVTPLVQVGVITLLVAGCSYGVGRTVAACVAGICWLLLNGFVVHDVGRLAFTGIGDVLRAVLLLTAALCVARGRHR